MKTPRTEKATIDNSHFSDWGTGPSPYVLASDMAELETELETTQQKCVDLEEVLADNRRLTRKLDVAMNGEHGAAKQASLCDLLAQAVSTQKQCAAMRSALGGAGSTLLTFKPFLPNNPRYGVLFNGKDVTHVECCDATVEILKRALSTDCGKGFVRREALEQCRDALKEAEGALCSLIFVDGEERPKITEKDKRAKWQETYLNPLDKAKEAIRVTTAELEGSAP